MVFHKLCTYMSIDPGSGVRLELFSNGYLIFEPDSGTN